jgi:hypothetical protein
MNYLIKIKQIIYSLLLSFTSFVIGQTQTKELYPSNPRDKDYLPGIYYKDMTHFQDQFVGTWLYENASTSTNFLLVLAKKEMIPVSVSDTYFEDVIVGGISYTVNNEELLNTLDEVNQILPTFFDYSLFGNSRRKYILPAECPECDPLAKVIRLELREPSLRRFEISNEFIVRHYVQNGVEKLKVWFRYTGNGIHEDIQTGEMRESPFCTIPYGEYVFIKQ